MANSKQTALITGASSGIGLELAKLFAKDHYNLILVADEPQKLQSAANEIKLINQCDVETIEADLSQENAPKEIYAQVQKKHLKVDVLVNNAGIGVYGDFITNSLEEELAMIRLNTIAVVELSKLFANDMVHHNNGGKILITSSVAALSGTPLLTVYGATKAFDFNFAMGLREELKKYNISVTALLPSETDTNFFRRAGMENSKITDGDMADPAVVADAGYEALMDGEAYVCSPTKAKFINILSHILPEDTKAKISKEEQEPKDTRGVA
jgi:short-subunit dehydrogenase